jgi:hypothetical protein
MFRGKDKTLKNILVSASGIVIISTVIATRRIWSSFIYQHIYPRRDRCELDASLFRHPDCPGDSADFLTSIIQLILARPTP